MKRKWQISSKINSFLLSLAFFLALLVRADRYFFKHNDSFCIRFIFSSLPNNPKWDLPPLTHDLDRIIHQKFTYFAKGTHCYAFVSDDQKYVLKVHRYPSHMRLFPWLTHPFSYRFNKKRIQIKEYNLRRHAYLMDNYKQGFEALKEETGTLLVHINRTDNLKKTITLVDKTRNTYFIPLDEITFILQHKAEPLYPSLDALLSLGQDNQAKDAITHIIQCIVQCCQKGFVNADPMLHKNYGLLADRAIAFDFGEMMQQEMIKQHEHYIPFVEKATAPLRAWIVEHHPELLAHYEEEIHLLMNSLNCVCKEEGTTSSMPPRSYMRK